MSDKKETVKNEVTKIEKNEMMFAEYNSPYGVVKLDANIIRSYLTKGNVAITDSEVVMFLEICKRQRLDPFVTGEVFLIKYSATQPAQVVIGYSTYKRRAEENPNYLGKEEGIVVLRGSEIIKKEGTCLYPNEKILGGWCKVSYLKSGHEVASYKEVEFSEYNQGNTMWKTKPGTMICKVAVSQALRDAFPTEMNGLYTPEELAPKEAKEEDFKPVKLANGEQLMTTVSVKISEAERKDLFDQVKAKGKDVDWLKAEVKKLGFESTSQLNTTQRDEILKNLEAPAEVTEETIPVSDYDLSGPSVLDEVEGGKQ